MVTDLPPFDIPRYRTPPAPPPESQPQKQKQTWHAVHFLHDPDQWLVARADERGFINFSIALSEKRCHQECAEEVAAALNRVYNA